MIDPSTTTRDQSTCLPGRAQRPRSPLPAPKRPSRSTHTTAAGRSRHSGSPTPSADRRSATPCRADTAPSPNTAGEWPFPGRRRLKLRGSRADERCTWQRERNIRLVERQPAARSPTLRGDGRERLEERYELEELVGRGGMSSVYRARDRILGREVAIKMLHEQYATDKDQVERFRREARAVAKLAQSNVAVVIDRGEDEGRPYIVFEYVEGGSLKRLIQETAPLPLDRVLELGVQIARGLEHAHRSGLVHRDVKPQNVLLDGAGVGQGDRLRDRPLVRRGAAGLDADRHGARQLRLHLPRAGTGPDASRSAPTSTRSRSSSTSSSPASSRSRARTSSRLRCGTSTRSRRRSSTGAPTCRRALPSWCTARWRRTRRSAR